MACPVPPRSDGDAGGSGDGRPRRTARGAWPTPWLRRALTLVAALALGTGCASAPPAPSPGATRSITLLTVNDVYRIEGLDDGRVGGLGRLRTLRTELERAAPGRVLLLHGGDVIFPSLPSRMYQGKQMIDVLNLLDGDPTPGRLDERMFVVFGNHEFDQEPPCGTPSPLAARVAESDFTWLSANVLSRCHDGAPRLSAVNLVAGRIVEVGGIRVGLFGLTLPTPTATADFLDPLATAAVLTADLRRRGAEVIIALTHLPAEEDQRILAGLRDRGLDLIVGGHEHEHMALPAGGAPRIFKADADAVTAWVIELRLGADGRLAVEPALRALSAAIPPDPAVTARASEWLARHEQEFCARERRAPGCLSEPLGRSDTALSAEEEKIRGQETSLGNWVADVMRAAFAACEADAAIINAGSLRLNHDLPAGTTVTRRHVEELMQYPSPLYLVEMSGADLHRAMDNAVSQPGAGRWLQISGLAFVLDPAPSSRRVTRLFATPAGGGPPVDVLANSDRRFRVVVTEYLTRGAEDGYVGILPAVSQALPCPASGADLKALILSELAAKKTIAPRAEGRICTAADAASRPADCQAERWSRSR